MGFRIYDRMEAACQAKGITLAGAATKGAKMNGAVDRMQLGHMEIRIRHCAGHRHHYHRTQPPDRHTSRPGQRMAPP